MLIRKKLIFHLLVFVLRSDTELIKIQNKEQVKGDKREG